MLKWLGGAFSEMDGHGQGTLMPPGLALNLFVTTTDINGYNRQIPISDPPAINTVVNKHVFEFHHRDGVGNLDSTHNPALAFAARATSCFPARFPRRRSPTSSTSSRAKASRRSSAASTSSPTHRST